VYLLPHAYKPNSGNGRYCARDDTRLILVFKPSIPGLKHYYLNYKSIIIIIIY
jgi:hypothetical protein